MKLESTHRWIRLCNFKDERPEEEKTRDVKIYTVKKADKRKVKIEKIMLKKPPIEPPPPPSPKAFKKEVTSQTLLSLIKNWFRALQGKLN